MEENSGLIMETSSTISLPNICVFRVMQYGGEFYRDQDTCFPIMTQNNFRHIPRQTIRLNWKSKGKKEVWEPKIDLKCFFFFFSFIFISWRLITLQYCIGFCHTLTWISHGFTCIPHPDPPSHLPLRLIPLDLPSAPGLSTCLMHPTWAGDLFHPR